MSHIFGLYSERAAGMTAGTDQDGVYLSKLLLAKGYIVYGSVPRSTRYAFASPDYRGVTKDVDFIDGDLTHTNAFTAQSIRQLMRACGFSEPCCYEDAPVAHGLKSLVRRILWRALTLPFRLLATAETGEWRHILSQNMLVVAERPYGR